MPKHLGLMSVPVFNTLDDALQHNPSSLSTDGTKLSLVGKEISSIGRLPTSVCYPIKVLYVSNNMLKSLSGIEQFPNIRILSCSNNNIRYLRELRWLRDIRLLEKVSFQGNQVTAMPFYREYILSLAPNLVAIDSSPVSWKEKIDAKSSSQRAQLFYDQLRLGELRNCILQHTVQLLRCHSELRNVLLGKFRSILASHVSSSWDYNEKEKFDCSDNHSRLWATVTGTEIIASTLRQALLGGTYRWLQVGCSDYFDRSIQDLAYKAHVAQINRMSSTQKEKLSSSYTELAGHWESVLYDCLERQQRLHFSLISSHDPAIAPLSSNSNKLTNASSNTIGNQNGPTLSALTNNLEMIKFETVSTEPQLKSNLMPKLAESRSTHYEHRDARNNTYCGLGPTCGSTVRPIGTESQCNVKERDTRQSVTSSSQNRLLDDTCFSNRRNKQLNVPIQDLGDKLFPQRLFSSKQNRHNDREVIDDRYNNLLIKYQAPSSSSRAFQLKTKTSTATNIPNYHPFQSLKTNLPPQQTEPEPGQEQDIDPKPTTSEYIDLTSHAQSSIPASHLNNSVDESTIAKFISETPLNLKDVNQHMTIVSEAEIIAVFSLPPLIQFSIKPPSNENINSDFEFKVSADIKSMKEMKVLVDAAIAELILRQRAEAGCWECNEHLMKEVNHLQKQIRLNADKGIKIISELHSKLEFVTNENKRASQWVIAVTTALERFEVIRHEISNQREDIKSIIDMRDELVAECTKTIADTEEVTLLLNQVMEAKDKLLRSMHSNPELELYLRKQSAIAKLASVKSAIDLELKKNAFIDMRLQTRRMKSIREFADAKLLLWRRNILVGCWKLWKRHISVTRRGKLIANWNVNVVKYEFFVKWIDQYRKSNIITSYLQNKSNRCIKLALIQWIGKHKQQKDLIFQIYQRQKYMSQFLLYHSFQRLKSVLLPVNQQLSKLEEAHKSSKASRFHIKYLFQSWRLVAYQAHDKLVAVSNRVIASHNFRTLKVIFLVWTKMLVVRKWVRLKAYNVGICALRNNALIRGVLELKLDLGLQALIHRYLRRGVNGFQTNIIRVKHLQIAKRKVKNRHYTNLVVTTWIRWLQAYRDGQDFRRKSDEAIDHYMRKLIFKHFCAWKKALIVRAGPANDLSILGTCNEFYSSLENIDTLNTFVTESINKLNFSDKLPIPITQFSIDWGWQDDDDDDSILYQNFFKRWVAKYRQRASLKKIRNTIVSKRLTRLVRKYFDILLTQFSKRLISAMQHTKTETTTLAGMMAGIEPARQLKLTDSITAYRAKVADLLQKNDSLNANAGRLNEDKKLVIAAEGYVDASLSVLDADEAKVDEQIILLQNQIKLIQLEAEQQSYSPLQSQLLISTLPGPLTQNVANDFSAGLNTGRQQGILRDIELYRQRLLEVKQQSMEESLRLSNTIREAEIRLRLATQQCRDIDTKMQTFAQDREGIHRELHEVSETIQLAIETIDRRRQGHEVDKSRLESERSKFEQQLKKLQNEEEMLRTEAQSLKDELFAIQRSQHSTRNEEFSDELSRLEERSSDLVAHSHSQSSRAHDGAVHASLSASRALSASTTLPVRVQGPQSSSAPTAVGSPYKSTATMVVANVADSISIQPTPSRIMYKLLKESSMPCYSDTSNDNNVATNIIALESSNQVRVQPTSDSSSSRSTRFSVPLLMPQEVQSTSSFDELVSPNEIDAEIDVISRRIKQRLRIAE